MIGQYKDVSWDLKNIFCDASTRPLVVFKEVSTATLPSHKFMHMTLLHCDLLTPSGIVEFGHHSFRLKCGACLLPNHHLCQLWYIVPLMAMNKFQWNLNQNRAFWFTNMHLQMIFAKCFFCCYILPTKNLIPARVNDHMPSKCGLKLLILSDTWMASFFRYGNWEIISSHTSCWTGLFIHAGNKLNLC